MSSVLMTHLLIKEVGKSIFLRGTVGQVELMWPQGRSVYEQSKGVCLIA